MWPFSNRRKPDLNQDRAEDTDASDNVELLLESPTIRLFTFKDDVPMQSRLARDVPLPAQTAIIGVCEKYTAIQACTLLDLRLPGTGVHEIKLFINLRLTDESQLATIGSDIARALWPFPEMADTTFVVALNNLDQYLPHAIFKRA